MSVGKLRPPSNSWDTDLSQSITAGDAEPWPDNKFRRIFRGGFPFWGAKCILYIETRTHIRLTGIQILTLTTRLRVPRVPERRLDWTGPTPDPADLSMEIRLLRDLIHEQANAPEGKKPANLDLVGKSIERLARVLKAQKSLSGDSGRRIDELLGSLLQEVGTELGIDDRTI